MGCWMGALGKLTIIPEPGNELIMEYAEFSKSACPKDYHEEEIFSNPWYFDEENRLASCVGKFAEPSVWYQFLKEDFFEPRGYQLCGDPTFIGEEELNFWEIGEKRYLEWKMCEKRMDELKKAYEQSV